MVSRFPAKVGLSALVRPESGRIPPPYDALLPTSQTTLRSKVPKRQAWMGNISIDVP
jgi:hypothetical protein